MGFFLTNALKGHSHPFLLCFPYIFIYTMPTQLATTDSARVEKTASLGWGRGGGGALKAQVSFSKEHSSKPFSCIQI